MTSCQADLAARGFTNVEVIEVPGAFEIPLRVKRLAPTGLYAALAGCALVIDSGSTSMNSSRSPSWRRSCGCSSTPTCGGRGRLSWNPRALTQEGSQVISVYLACASLFGELMDGHSTGLPDGLANRPADADLV